MSEARPRPYHIFVPRDRPRVVLGCRCSRHIRNRVHPLMTTGAASAAFLLRAGKEQSQTGRSHDEEAKAEGQARTEDSISPEAMEADGQRARAGLLLHGHSTSGHSRGWPAASLMAGDPQGGRFSWHYVAHAKVYPRDMDGAGWGAAMGSCGLFENDGQDAGSDLCAPLS